MNVFFPYRRSYRARTGRVLLLATFLTLLSVSSVRAQAEYIDTINVEIDYMVLYDSVGNVLHSHMPRPIEVQAVVQMFACQNILCNIEISDEVPHVDVLKVDPNDSLNFFEYYGPESFGAIKFNYRDHWDCWHYCVFAHAFQTPSYTTTSSSGMGELFGDEFIVTLGLWLDSVGTPFERAATLVHELGHNLGLVHAPGMDEETVGPHSPNHPSIMSYFCQMLGVKWQYEDQGLVPPHAHLFKNLDYSYGNVCTIDESALDERFGIGMRKIDWDCSGAIDISAVSQDLARDSIGHWCLSNGTLSVLRDHNEWATYQDMACIIDPEKLKNRPVITCITNEEWNQFRKLNPEIKQPPVEIEPCIASRMLWVVPAIGGVGGGWCDNPYLGFTQGYDAALSGDILYLKYGTYYLGSSSVVLNKRMVVTATDAAVLLVGPKAGTGNRGEDR